MNGRDMGKFVRVCKNENSAGFLVMDETSETTVWNIPRSRLGYEKLRQFPTLGLLSSIATPRP